MIEFGKSILIDNEVKDFNMTRLALPRGYRHAESLLFRLHNEPEDKWVSRGQNRTVHLFQSMAEKVPAYAKFLKDNHINPKDIKTVDDLARVPALNKDNYLRAYNRKELCWNGTFDTLSWVVASTSGSTGEPYYFPRQSLQDKQYALTAELYLLSNFQIDKKSTLYIDAFAMGVWIGGLFTYEAVKTIAERGDYALSIITPGLNKAEVIKAVKHLGKEFDQIIIGSYPPILKDILDDGVRDGINWDDYNVGFVFSAEGFTETFRDYVSDVGGVKEPLRHTLNHYGTVDLGTMAHETPLSILIRRMALTNEKFFHAIFGQTTKLPTLAQYVPEMFYFEEVDGSLLCSAFAGIPLVRYDLKDHGGVIGFEQMKQIFSDNGIDIIEEAKRAGIEDTVWNLPFVHVYERSDFSVTFMGFQVYPEPIRRALNTPELQPEITGKFTIVAENDEQEEQQLLVHIELKAGKEQPSAALQARVQELVTKALTQDNPIYKMNYETLGARVQPIISFWPYEHGTHFNLGGKQKWVKK